MTGCRTPWCVQEHADTCGRKTHQCRSCRSESACECPALRCGPWGDRLAATRQQPSHGRKRACGHGRTGNITQASRTVSPTGTTAESGTLVTRRMEAQQCGGVVSEESAELVHSRSGHCSVHHDRASEIKMGRIDQPARCVPGAPGLGISPGPCSIRLVTGVGATATRSSIR